MKYFNEYYYGLDLIAFNNMNHPNPWYINRDINLYHKDALGSITAITDRYENVVERYRYDAYGNPYEGRFLHMSKNNPYGFTGQRFEPELRMYSFAYRTYNPMSMRWMTVDPVRDGTNWYLYVSGDPVNLWDPLGLCGEYFDESGYTELNIGDSILLFYPDGLTKSIKIDITIIYIHDSPKGEEFALELYKQQKKSDKDRAAVFFVVGVIT